MLAKKLTIKCKINQNLREAGGPANSTIVIATGKGIAMDKESNIFIASSDIYLTKDWAKCLMKHMRMVKRTASTRTMTTVIKYNELKKPFLQDIKH